MNLARIVQFAGLLWLLSEVALILRTRRRDPGFLRRDRGSRVLLWCVSGAGVAAGTAVSRFCGTTRIGIPEPCLMGISLALIAAGVVIRWTAILTLGSLFNTRVVVQQDHRLVRTGLYRWVRHPSYSGLLLVFLGLGLSFGNWLSVAVIVVPFFAVLLYRIQVEESSLLEALGQDYAEYCKTTKRLLPGIF
jgi:protein-S-isoprenylcysteine O-methyltransferase Ste14